MDYLRKEGSDVATVSEMIVKDSWPKIAHTETGVELASYGLARYTHDALHNRHHLRALLIKYEDIDVEVAEDKGTRKRTVNEVDVVLSSVLYTGKDNTLRPVIEFDVEDCLAARNDALRKAEGYKRLAQWFDSAAKSLKRHKAKCIRLLPQEEKRKLITSYYIFAKEVH